MAPHRGVGRRARVGGAGALALEIDMDTATQAVTLEVIHEALFSETLDVIDEEPDAVAPARSFAGSTRRTKTSSTISFSCTSRDTPDAHSARDARSRLRSHFDARADAREALIASGNAKDAFRRICSPRCSRRATPPRARADARRRQPHADGDDGRGQYHRGDGGVSR